MLQTIAAVNQAVNNFIWGVPAMVCIIGVGLLLSVRTGFIQIRKFPYAIKTTIGRMFRKRDASDGAMTPFQAVCTALAATVGTGNIAGAVGLGAALDYVEKTGIHEISRYEHELLVYAMDQFKRISGLHLIGNAADRTSVLSFVMDGYDVSEIGHYLSRHGIAVRAGHHCAQPALRRYGLEATVRPSLAFYNTFEEIDCLVKTLLRLRQY